MNDGVKTPLRRLIELAHERQMAQVAALSDAERAEMGTPERWSAKDHLAHTMYWKQRLAERLAAAARGETPAASADDFQPINEANFETHRDRAWAEILADDARIHADLLARLDALSEEELLDPTRFAWTTGEPLLTNMLGAPYWHVQEHVAQRLRDAGDVAGATHVYETFTRAVTTSDLPPIAPAYAIYNLACYYALAGDTARALELLAEALRLHPSLTEWSKQDPDFAALRDDPAYQALYTG